MDAEMVARLRRFNRVVTQRVGALDDRFLARDRPLGEARVLREIGPDGCDVRTLRERLDLDSGYLSRLLRSLEGAGLVTVGRSEPDKRVRTARLTPAGVTEVAELDRRSDELAWSFLEPLNRSQRERLIAAVGDVERLFTAGMVEIAAIDPDHPHARYCLNSYITELNERFETGWDPMKSISADPDELRPPAVLLLVAALRGEPVGCGRPQVPRTGAHRDQADVGLWVGARAGHRAPSTDRARSPSRGRGQPDRPARNQRIADRSDRHVPLVGLPGGRSVQRRAVRSSLVREGPIGNGPNIEHPSR